MNKTPNYQLNQWDADDRVLRTDFNADNAKIDAALQTLMATKAEIVIGTYIGDDAESRFIDLGFTPKAVLLFNDVGMAHSINNCFGGLCLPGCPVKSSYDRRTVLEIVDNGFMVYFNEHSQVYSNRTQYSFYYLAVK